MADTVFSLLPPSTWEVFLFTRQQDIKNYFWYLKCCYFFFITDWC